MANEATVRCGLKIRVGNIDYDSKPTSFNADVSGQFGPVPGAVVAGADGTDVDLTALTVPGLCRIGNIEPAGGNELQVGRWDNASELFYPLMRVKPGEYYVVRLDPDVLEEYAGTGTGTTAAASALRVKGVGGPANCVIECFEA